MHLIGGGGRGLQLAGWPAWVDTIGKVVLGLQTSLWQQAHFSLADSLSPIASASPEATPSPGMLLFFFWFLKMQHFPVIAIFWLLLGRTWVLPAPLRWFMCAAVCRSWSALPRPLSHLFFKEARYGTILFYLGIAVRHSGKPPAAHLICGIPNPIPPCMPWPEHANAIQSAEMFNAMAKRQPHLRWQAGF